MIFHYPEEKYIWWSAYSILVLVHRNVGALFYFNLTCDVTQDYIPEFVNRLSRTSCRELGRWRGNSSYLFELPSLFPREGGRASATLSFLMFKLTVTWKTALSISLLSRTLQSNKTKHRLHTEPEETRCRVTASTASRAGETNLYQTLHVPLNMTT